MPSNTYTTLQGMLDSRYCGLILTPKSMSASRGCWSVRLLYGFIRKNENKDEAISFHKQRYGVDI